MRTQLTHWVLNSYILAANVHDFSGQMWISGFNDIGELLLGVTATELNQIKVSSHNGDSRDARMSAHEPLAASQEEDETRFASILHDAANRMFMFNCRAKQDTFNVSSPAVRKLNQGAHTDNTLARNRTTRAFATRSPRQRTSTGSRQARSSLRASRSSCEDEPPPSLRVGLPHSALHCFLSSCRVYNS